MDNTMRDVINAAREYGFFVDRGDPANYDFTEADFTKDNAWHEFDLSAIVPEHAHAVLFGTQVRGTSINRRFGLRTHGNVEARNASFVRIQTAGVNLHADLSCPCNAKRTFDYVANDVSLTVINLVVKGWWY